MVEGISRCVKDDPVAVADHVPLLHARRIDLVHQAGQRASFHQHVDLALEVLAVGAGHDLLDRVQHRLERRRDAIDLAHDRHRLLAPEREARIPVDVVQHTLHLAHADVLGRGGEPVDVVAPAAAQRAIDEDVALQGFRHDPAVFAPPLSMSFVPSRPVAYACLALSMSLVGSYVALSKPLAAAFPVLLLAWLRFGIGALAMLHWLRKPADEAPLTMRTKRLLFLESFLGNFLFSLCMLFGVSLTSAVSAGVIMAAIPATVALLSWLFLRERISGRTATAIGLAALGIGLLAFANPTHPAGTAGNFSWLGNLLVLGAVVCEAS